jgi:alpha-ribazole phosphatase
LPWRYSTSFGGGYLLIGDNFVEVYLIRHTTPDIAKGLIYGHLDVPLANTFDSEKAIILNTLPQDIDRVFSSPSRRCQFLAKAISPQITIVKGIKELNFGLWEGLSWDEINRTESDYWMEDFVNRCPPQGETLLQMEKRVLEFWQDLSTLNCPKIAVVTHVGVIRIILSHIKQAQLQSIFDIPVGYGQVFALTYNQ